MELFCLCQDKNPQLSPGWSTIYHRKRSVGNFAIGNQDMLTEFEHKGVRQGKKGWDVVDLVWVQSSAYEWKVGVLRGHSSQVQFDFAESQRGHWQIGSHSQWTGWPTYDCVKEILVEFYPIIYFTVGKKAYSRSLIIWKLNKIKLFVSI